MRKNRKPSAKPVQSLFHCSSASGRRLSTGGRRGLVAVRVDRRGERELLILASHGVRELGIEPFQGPEELEEQRRSMRGELHRAARPAETACRRPSGRSPLTRAMCQIASRAPGLKAAGASDSRNSWINEWNECHAVSARRRHVRRPLRRMSRRASSSFAYNMVLSATLQRNSLSSDHCLQVVDRLRHVAVPHHVNQETVGSKQDHSSWREDAKAPFGATHAVTHVA